MVNSVSKERRNLSRRNSTAQTRRCRFTIRKKWKNFLQKLENAEYEITEVKKGERIKNAPLPFTTSTLQQEACQDTQFFHTEDNASGTAVIRGC